MKKTLTSALLIGVSLSSVLFSTAPAFADKKEKITICHATGSDSNPYNVITVSGNALKNGHTEDKGDIIPADEACIKKDPTPDPEDQTDAEPVETVTPVPTDTGTLPDGPPIADGPGIPPTTVPVTPAPEPVPSTPTETLPDESTTVGSGQTFEPNCDATPRSGVVITDGVAADPRPLTEEETLQFCNPVPGDKPVAETPVVVDESYPAAPPAAKDLVSTNVAPAPSAPLVQTGTTEVTTAPSQLANTGFNVGAFVASILILGAGIGLLRLKRKLA